MATAEIPAQAPAEPKRLSLADYDEMIRDGRLGKDDKVELLDGLLVKKMTKGFRHVAITRRISKLLDRRLPADWTAFKEDPVVLPFGPVENAPSRPEPDVAVVQGSDDDYAERYPLPGDMVLAVEVASNAQMLARDRNGLARYAFNNIPCVWIVNLAANVIEVYTRPTGPGVDPVYEDNAVKRPGETITVPLGGGNDVNLDVGELLA